MLTWARCNPLLRHQSDTYALNETLEALSIDQSKTSTASLAADADTKVATQSESTSLPSEVFVSVGAGTRYKFIVPVDMIVEDLTSSTPTGCEPVQLQLNTVTTRLSLDPSQSNDYAYFECVLATNSLGA